MPKPQSPPTSEQIVLAVQDLVVQDDRAIPRVQALSFQLRAGEILGIAGVDGNGQRELADAIAGLRPVTQGQIWLQGEAITDWTVGQRRQAKLGYIPDDRQTTGLVLPFSIARNLILKAFRRWPFSRWGWLRPRAIAAHADRLIQTFDIRASSRQISVRQLSGGNQQKVVLARELSAQPDLIIALQPTRGLDIGATDDVRRALLAARDRGAAILYSSTELPDVMGISDRIAVMYAGQFLAILPAQTATVEQIGWLMAGGGPRSNQP